MLTKEAITVDCAGHSAALTERRESDRQRDINHSGESTLLTAHSSFGLACMTYSVAEPHHFYAAPAPGENFDAAPAPTLLYCRSKNFKGVKGNISFNILFSSDSL
jgi:hypothetical protein